MIAHVGGVPVEETVLPLLSGVGVGLLLARSWIASRGRSRDLDEVAAGVVEHRGR